MENALQNPLIVQLSNKQTASIKWGFNWYPGGREIYEARYSAINWEETPTEEANDMSNPKMRIERTGEVDKVTILQESYHRRATSISALDLLKLSQAAALIQAQVDFARLAEIHC